MPKIERLNKPDTKVTQTTMGQKTSSGKPQGKAIEGRSYKFVASRDNSKLDTGRD